MSESGPRVSVIIPAAGASRRFGGKVKKIFAKLGGREIFLRTLELFINRDDVCEVIFAVSPDDYDEVKRKYGANLGFMGINLVKGGDERYKTVRNAIETVSDEATLIAIHDAVRPCITQDNISEVFQAAAEKGAAVLACPENETLKRIGEDKTIEATVDRSKLYKAQTPQVFEKNLIVDAYAKLSDNSITDDAQAVELAGGKVTIVESAATNIKITRVSDIKLAEAILKTLPKPKAKNPTGPWAGEAEW